MALLTLTLTQETSLNEIKEFSEPISLDELVSLGSLKKSSVLYAITQLIKKNAIKRKRKKGKGIIWYYSIKQTKKNTPKTEDIIVKPSPSSEYPLKKPLSEMDIQERCYHLLLAGRSKSSGSVADFFSISEDQAVRLLRGIAEKYPHEIKLDIMAKVI